MAENQKYYLAMYDIRGKQEFIFRTNHIKEIVGGSCIIRDCFKDYLYLAAVKYRDTLHKVGGPAIYNYQDDGAEKEFSEKSFKNRMNQPQYIGEVVYDGGGNFLVLYNSEKAFEAINRIFTKDLLREIGTLKVLCTCVEVTDFSDYEGDRKRLYEKHRNLEATESVIRPTAMLPFTQIDPQTSMPLVRYREDKKVTKESYKKLDKYTKEMKKEKEKIENFVDDLSGEKKEIFYGENYLDYLVKKKGEDSMLAVIFIDGNNMGAQVQALLDPDKNNGQEDYKGYDFCVNKLRRFSEEIQTHYVEDRVKEIHDALEKKHPNDPYYQHRMVVFAGDEMSFIVRAEDAWTAVKAYFDGMKKVNDKNKERIQKGETGYCSSCAGIALFHSHAPYAEAYAIAEECCESAKKFMKANDKDKAEWQNTCLVDFHYCQGGLGMDLKTIRKREVGELISKPWVWLDPENETSGYSGTIAVSEVEAICDDLNKLGSRTNVKGLAMAAMESESALYEELARIKAHQTDPEIRELDLFKLEGERGRNLLYDIVMVYDQWFRKPALEGEKING